jgi:hypothetical protein
VLQRFLEPISTGIPAPFFQRYDPSEILCQIPPGGLKQAPEIILKKHWEKKLKNT